TWAIRCTPPGAAAGYRLGAGAALPPLLLDDDEAIAVAVGLRAAGGGLGGGVEGSGVRAPGQNQQGLPARLGPAAGPPADGSRPGARQRAEDRSVAAHDDPCSGSTVVVARGVPSMLSAGRAGGQPAAT